MSDGWGHLPALGANAEDPLGSRSASRASLVCAIFPPVLVASGSPTVNVARNASLTTPAFNPVQGTVGLLVVASVTSHGGVGSYLQIFGDMASANELGLIVSNVDGQRRTQQFWVPPNNGQVIWSGVLGTAISYDYAFSIAGWIRNP